MTDQSSRRSFLGKLAAGAAIAATATAHELSAKSLTSPDLENYWRLVRLQFPFSEDKVPMNAANLAPSPRAVSQVVTDLTADIDTDCSFHNRAKFRGMLEETRKKVAMHLGVSEDEIALVRNTSEANNTINNGLSLKPGDEVVIWDQNHPTNNIAWEVRAARFGFRLRKVSTRGRQENREQLLEAFTSALSDRTRVLAITHLSNTTGVLLPVSELCRTAHKRGIFVHVDGAQTWGALKVDLRQLGCDSYSASAHKWLLGPKEVGILYLRRDRVPDVWPNVVAPGWGNDVEPDPIGARKFESLGQRDDAALAAVGTTVDWHKAIGPDRIERRIHELAAELKSGLGELGFQVVTPPGPELSGGVCVVQLAPESRQQVLDHLYNSCGIAAASTGGLRLCPHIYNTKEHIERALEGLRKMEKPSARS